MKMPAAYFKPVGRAFIIRFNEEFNVQPPWDPDVWGKYAFSYFVYAVCGSYVNLTHPGFFRTADAQLQVHLGNREFTL